METSEATELRGLDIFGSFPQQDWDPNLVHIITAKKPD